MLLHSRQGSGEHRPIDINAVVEESLNLAYHGARAERQGFNITLEKILRSRGRRSRPVSAGDHARAAQSDLERLLRYGEAQGAEANGAAYEPTLAAATKRPRRQRRNQDTRQRHRHSAGGEGKDVQSVLHDQTGRRGNRPRPVAQPRHHRETACRHDQVDTEPGEFTEFRIVLPRARGLARQDGRQP